MLLIGESINATIPAIGRAVVARDKGAIIALARRQVELGAHMLDVNAGGLVGRDEASDLVWLVQAVQQAVGVPLVLDSGSPDALRAALDVYRGPPPTLSSISGETDRVEAVLPLAIQRSCAVVALCMHDQGIPPTAEGRMAIAAELIGQAAAAGMPPGNIYVDPLIMAVAADYRAGLIALATIRALKERFPAVQTICGLSNVSFGSPARRLLNRTFAAMLIANGVDALIADVRDRALTAMLLSAQALIGQDAFCRSFLKAYRAGELKGETDATCLRSTGH